MITVHKRLKRRVGPANLAKSNKKRGFLLIGGMLLAIGLFLLLFGGEGYDENETGSRKKALILDPLYNWIPNAPLLDNLISLLREAGYSVKVVKGANATVDAFRNITLYDLVIIRSHGGYFEPGDTLGGKTLDDYAPVVFTGEPFSECLPLSCKYYIERLREEVVAGVFSQGSVEVTVFAITPLFFKNLKGTFNEEAVVIVASCYGLAGHMLADAVIDKGARCFISWSWKVTPSHMDAALKLLIKKVVRDGIRWVEAVKEVSREMGADPLGGGMLKITCRKES